MKKLFGTDGVRGIANTELTPELAFKLGKAGAHILAKNATSTPKILIGKDGRRSGDMLEAALTAGLCSIGAEVYQAGILPTPAVAYLIQKYKFDAGIMITASHNPMEDNGIKFFSAKGLKLPDQLEEEIEALVHTNASLPCPEGEGVGIVRACPHALEDYASFVISTVPNLHLNGMKIALDCANGATSAIAPIIFEKLGAEVHTLHNCPNGININANCGSTHMDSVKNFVTSHNLNLGLAFDGDGDRMFAVDENGQEIDGDRILAICGLDLSENNQLAKNTIVATVMSNQGLEVFCREKNITLLRTDVGDRYVLKKMIEDDLSLGGEQSGHLIFRKHSTTGDGILAGVQLLSVLYRKKKSMAEMAKLIEIFPQVLINAKVPNDKKHQLQADPEIKKALAEVEANLSADERILVRPSGTEPLVRVMIEGRDAIKITEWATKLVQIIEERG